MQFGHLNSTQQRGVRILLLGGATVLAGNAIAFGGIFGDVYGHEHNHPPNATQLTAYPQHCAAPGLTTSNVFELFGTVTSILGWLAVAYSIFTIYQGTNGGEKTALVDTL